MNLDQTLFVFGFIAFNLLIFLLLAICERPIHWIWYRCHCLKWAMINRWRARF